MELMEQTLLTLGTNGAEVGEDSIWVEWVVGFLSNADGEDIRLNGGTVEVEVVCFVSINGKLCISTPDIWTR